MENKKQIIEIADIFRDKKHDFLTENTLCAVQQKAMEDIIACRTSELGGHTLSCNHCGHKVQSYNSCRNRNCPKCQYIKRMQWVPSAKKFFVPVKVLSTVFRGILCRLLQESVFRKEIKLPDDTPDFQTIKAKCYAKKWVVYAEKPFASPDNLVRYLGNYTHRVAISNHRMVGYKDDKVTFSYRDNKAGGARKTMTLETMEFIRRFMQHVLPCGFSKIRYFGFMAICKRKTKLNLCYSLLPTPTYFSRLTGLLAMEVLQIISGKDPIICAKCKKGKLMVSPACNVLHIEPG
jgi:hypothetical protein